MRPIFKPLAVALLASTLIACSDNDDDDDDNGADLGNIVEVAEADGRFTTLLTALEAVDLDEVLGDVTGTFTVFAPNDDAFDALPDGTLDALLADPDRLADVLRYHVISGSAIDSTTAIAAAGTTLTTVNADEIGVALEGENLFINAAQVVIPDVAASNGVIHVVNQVLIPSVDSSESGNIAQEATDAGVFGTLLAALAETGLDATLQGEGPFTVFAPTDDAFDDFLEESGLTAQQLLEADNLSDILLYHVISGKEVNAAAATAIAGNTVEMANMDNMALSASDDDLFANLSSVVDGLADVDASNGIIHVIDKVLVPPQDAETPTLNIVETAQANPELFSTLVTALSATSDLVGVLSNAEGDFTVFAPTDDAFDALPENTLTTLLGDPDGALRDILMKHVVAGSVDSVTAFTLNGAEVSTVNEDGETIELEIDSGSLTVDDAEIITFDIVTTNGIIHVIDSVILLDE